MPQMSSPRFGSSHISKLGYDEESGTLYVQFQKGGTYAYEGVGLELASALHNSHSPGSLFRSRILRNFKGKRL